MLIVVNKFYIILFLVLFLSKDNINLEVGSCHSAYNKSQPMIAKWNDEYWLLLMQLYLRKPMGTKPIYSRDMVDLALELHLPPKYLYGKMLQLRRLDTPRIEHLWNTYAKHPMKLSKGVQLLRRMQGFNNATSFYEGVEVSESFETEFKPLPDCGQLTPMMLVIILDQYFRLTPNTMVEETAEIKSLAQMMDIPPSLIVEVMNIYQALDPCLRRTTMPDTPLATHCKQVWKRYGNDDPIKLAAYAAQLHEYFR